LVEIVKSLVFLTFVAVGLTAAWAARYRPGRSRAIISVLVVYAVMVSFAVGFTQRESWPFSTWPFIAGRVARPSTFPRIVATDAQRNEYQIDYRAWEPLEFDELMAWKDQSFFRLDPATRDVAAAYLLDRIETARRQWRASEPPNNFNRFFGPLSAPLFLGHRGYWDAGAPHEAFTGLRFYAETWDVEERARDPSKIKRQLVYEYRQP
jgi:hypothetical protein